jgi:hypothetical protein
MVDGKRILINEMNSLVRDYHQMYHGEQQILTLCNKM